MIYLACACVAVAVTVCGQPMVAAARSHLSHDARVNHARTLIHGGHHRAALDALRPLALAREARARSDITDIRFLIGVAAIAAAQGVDDDAQRTTLLSEAIAALRAILLNRPSLVRVRLELARAFFLKQDDVLARQHFRRVLAGLPAAAVAANVNRFLLAIRDRRRWRSRLGWAVAPDTNINNASDVEFIYINGLPFRRSEASHVRSGVGVVAWGGSEYQYPLGPRLRMRANVDLHHTAYRRTRHGRTLVSSHVGPRLLYGPRTEFSLLGLFQRFWLGDAPYLNGVGVRMEAERRLSPQLSLSGRVEYIQRTFMTIPARDGASAGLWFTANYLMRPTISWALGGGSERQDARATMWRNTRHWFRTGLFTVLPLGVTAGLSVDMHWTAYDGNWFPFTFDGESRRDRRQVYRLTLLNRAVTVYGFSPQVVLTHEIVDSNAQQFSYDRDRAEMQFVRQF